MNDNHATALKSLKDTPISKVNFIENSLKNKNNSNTKLDEKVKVLQEELTTLSSTIILLVTTLPGAHPPAATSLTLSESRAAPSSPEASMPHPQLRQTFQAISLNFNPHPEFQHLYEQVPLYHQQ